MDSESYIHYREPRQVGSQTDKLLFLAILSPGCSKHRHHLRFAVLNQFKMTSHVFTSEHISSSLNISMLCVLLHLETPPLWGRVYVAPAALYLSTGPPVTTLCPLPWWRRMSCRAAVSPPVTASCIVPCSSVLSSDGVVYRAVQQCPLPWQGFGPGPQYGLILISLKASQRLWKQ